MRQVIESFKMQPVKRWSGGNIPLDVKGAIRIEIQRGVPRSAVSKVYRVSIRTIRRIMEQELGQTTPQKGSQPSADSSLEPSPKQLAKAEFVGLIESNPNQTYDDVSRALFEAGVTKKRLSRSTIHRWVYECGYCWRVRPKCCYIDTTECRERRFDFAKAQAALGQQHWIDKVSACDECSLQCVSSRKQGQIVLKGKRADPAPRARWNATVHIFGLITPLGHRFWRLPNKGSGPRGGVTGADIVSVISRDVADIKRLCAGTVLIVDGAGTHNQLKEFFSRHNIAFFSPWPAHSPDLNPIENWWSELRFTLDPVHLPGTTEEDRNYVWEQVKECNRLTPREHFRTYLNSFYNRLLRCIETKGGWIGK